MYDLKCPVNELVRSYPIQSDDRKVLKACLTEMARNEVQIPCVIGGQSVLTRDTKKVVMPHEHHHVLGHYHLAQQSDLEDAIDAARKAKPEWESLGWQDRAAIFLKAAELLSGPWRARLNAATMLGQSKNAYQAEIDAACELADFFRFNAYFYQELIKQQPVSTSSVWNQSEVRPLEGFVVAITPFNFTAIAGNLPAAPALVGNTVIWKPSDTQMLSAHYTMQLLMEAGLPPGVINLVAADAPQFGKLMLSQRDLAGVHFTGSTATFRSIWKTVGENISHYVTYPRLVGETGGKGFVFVHPSANVDVTVAAFVRGAFEYQGQKCSAASRAYVPRSLWKQIQVRLLAEVKTIQMGDVRDFSNFVNAVIDERAFKKISAYLDHAKHSPSAKILVGGNAKEDIGFFIEPTVILAEEPNYQSMVEEIFGPVLTVFVYDDSRLEEVLEMCDRTSPYSLTGAVIAQDRRAISAVLKRLRYSAGNFYINDKPTGAVVGQQPFGGGRASGTNDKAGSALNLARWLSPRSIKETFVPAQDYRYPFLERE
jgi:1-pyrroline-5-carboxylate dehydrogenase